jgi:hypothetical protein
MADDALEERFRQHEHIMEGLARMLAAQHEFNREQRDFNREQRTINERLTTVIERLDVTLVAIKDLLGRDKGNSR